LSYLPFTSLKIKFIYNIMVEIKSRITYIYALLDGTKMKRDKNIKITTKTHELLKKYCEQNGLKMFSFVEKLIRESCVAKKDLYGEN